MGNYIYYRTSVYYDIDNAYKIGSSSNLYNRDNSYNQRDFRKGTFMKVIKITNHSCHYAEKKLQTEFIKYNIRKGGGTDFYDKITIHLFKDVFKKYNIKYKILSDKEIRKLMLFEKLYSYIKNNRYKIKHILEEYRTKENNLI